LQRKRDSIQANYHKLREDKMTVKERLKNDDDLYIEYFCHTRHAFIGDVKKGCLFCFFDFKHNAEVMLAMQEKK
jgi:hypothetical protein